jgi:hypothetical protein
MTALDRLIPAPRMREANHVDLAAPPALVWERVRHGDLGRSPLTRALFTVRTLPERLAGHARGQDDETELHLDDMRSTPERPGFQILVDDPPREVAVGAIGKVWQLEIPFLHVPDAAAYAAVAEPGWIKVAWSLRITPLGERDSRLELEVRVHPTDEASWDKFRRYFRLIGPGSHFIRRSLLAALARELGTPAAAEKERPLPGDELLPDAQAQFTHGITIAASPEAIWPWLVQMGCHRAGFYSVDVLDNAGVRSAREVHPEWQTIQVGQILPATPRSEDGFEVLRVEPPRVLALGGLYDPDAEKQLKFDAPRPPSYWQATWTFVLEPQGPGHTRVHVRVRGAFSPSERLHAAWIRPVHAFMQGAQLRHLKARVEGRETRDDWRDVIRGVAGAARMALAMATPFFRRGRNHWGLSEADAARAYPGDELIRDPRWGWTHAVEIDAPATEVWPWVAQIGADRAGFYTYQWLENVAGCDLRNAEVVHPEWQVKPGDKLVLHPKQPALTVVRVDPGRAFVAHAPIDETARREGKPWVTVSWLFMVEPLGEDRCRFISRYRAATSGDLTTRVRFGPALVEPVGFVMDRGMLLGVKRRAEKSRAAAAAPAPASA